MNTSTKLLPGQTMEPLTFKSLDGSDYIFGGPCDGWKALFFIRGQHCPICKVYLGEIDQRRDAFAKLGISVAAVSADNKMQSQLTAGSANFSFPLLYGLDEAMMRRLGLYISEPRSAQETDHLFSEPALLVLNPDGLLHLIDIANAPFVRTDLDRLLSGLGVIIQKQYPVRGTHA